MRMLSSIWMQQLKSTFVEPSGKRPKPSSVYVPTLKFFDFWC